MPADTHTHILSCHHIFSLRRWCSDSHQQKKRQILFTSLGFQSPPPLHFTFIPLLWFLSSLLLAPPNFLPAIMLMQPARAFCSGDRRWKDGGLSPFVCQSKDLCLAQDNMLNVQDVNLMFASWKQTLKNVVEKWRKEKKNLFFVSGWKLYHGHHFRLAKGG